MRNASGSRLFRRGKKWGRKEWSAADATLRTVCVKDGEKKTGKEGG